MARIAGVDLPREKRVEIGLTYIYGIGLSTSQKILKEAGVNPDTRVKDLTEDQEQAIRKAMEGITVEGDLRREVALNIKRLTEIGCYRGLRHRRSLPVRGQRTKTNARTRKGPRKLVSKSKKKRVEIGLTYIYGIGLSTSQKILKEAGVNPDTRVKDLTEDQEQAIRKAMEGITVEGDLRREVALNIKRLTEIGCYRGLRHRRSLPVRGQRTKTNARTRKGPRKLVSKSKK